MFRKIVGYFKTREKWETIFFSESIDVYSRIKGKFNNENILTKTKITHSPYGSSSYEILVKQSDLHRANEIVHPL